MFLKRVISSFSLKILVRDARMVYRSAWSLWTVESARRRNLTVDRMFENTAQKYPNKVCFLFEEEKWTYKKVQVKVNQVANYFKNQGFAKGDPIGLFMENRPEFVCIWLGLAKVYFLALINYNLRKSSLDHCIKTGFCKGLIYDGNLHNAIEGIQENGILENGFKLYSFTTSNGFAQSNVKAIDLTKELSQSSTQEPDIGVPSGYNDKLFYMYTSGTTGLPKAAVIKHSRFIYASSTLHFFTQLRHDDVIYASLPLYHATSGIYGIGQALQWGTTVAIGRVFSASQFWHDCIKHKATVIQYIGEVCRYLLAKPFGTEDLQHKVRLAIGNGLRPEIWTEFLNRFNIPNVAELFGSTEGNCNIMCFDNTVGAVGFLPHFLSPFIKFHILRVDKDTGNILRDSKTGLALRCKDDEPGELVGIIDKKSPLSDFEGYTDEEAKRKKIVTNVLRTGDQAFRSGDILVRDRFGYFYFLDRQGDTFRWKGENVSTLEVENVISKAIGLRDTVVYGVTIPGADGKAGMAAIVDPDNSVNFEILAANLCTQLPVYARPLFIRIMKQIDMTGTYKFKKQDLQKEGFDITKLQDPVYFLLSGKYVPLNLCLFDSIMTGKTRV